MDPRIKARLQQTEQVDPLDERVRSYLLERMSAAPEEAPDLSRERQLDALGTSGTNISNIFLNRAGLGPVKAGEGFEAAARRDIAAKPKETRDELASGLYSSNLRERLAGIEAERHARELEQRAKQVETEAELKRAQEAQRAGESNRDYEARMAALRQSADQFDRKLSQDKALGYAAINARNNESGRQMEADVQKLSKEIGDNPALVTEKINRINSILNDPRFKDDLPGIGPLDSQRPDMLTSPEGLQLASDAKELVNVLLFMQSGAGVSNQERENKYRAYGLGRGSSETAFRQGMAKLPSDLAAAVKSKQAGFRPEVVAKFKERGGATADQMTGAQPAAPQVGKVPMISLATGKTVMLSPESAAALEKAGKVKKP